MVKSLFLSGIFFCCLSVIMGAFGAHVLKDKLSELQKQELTLAKSLSNKYGEGSLDLETGTFTPTN